MLKLDHWTWPLSPGFERLQETEQENRPIYADVQFGQPSMRCRGSGICRVDLYQGMTYKSFQGNCAKAIAIIELRQDRVHLLFSKYSVCRHLAETYFEKGKIRLHESVALSESLSANLGIPGIELPKGVFTVAKEGSYYSIGFPAVLHTTYRQQYPKSLQERVLP